MSLLTYTIGGGFLFIYFLTNLSQRELFEIRFIPTLSSNEVADRVLSAMRCNEKFAIIPSYLQVLLAAKW